MARKSLVTRLPRPWKGVLRGFVAAILLLPVPAWATLMLDWSNGGDYLSSSNTSLIGVAPSGTGGNTLNTLNFTINSLGGPSDAVTIQGLATVTATPPTQPHITVNLSGWNGPINVGQGASLAFSFSYNGGRIYQNTFLQNTTPGGSGAGNQFTGIIPQSEVASGQLLFSVTMNGSYTTNSSTASISFVESP